MDAFFAGFEWFAYAGVAVLVVGLFALLRR
jgi:hypothetical protein